MNRRYFYPLALLSVLLASCGGGGGTGSAGNSSTQAPASTAGGNVLFVGDGSNNVIAAFDILVPAGGGTVSGKILSSDFPLRNGGQLDAARNLLYVGAFHDVAVFANASALSGKITPARTFTPNIAKDAHLGRIFLDSANDRLYIGYGVGGQSSVGFAVFDNVSTLTGAVTPARTIRGPVDTYNFTIDSKRGLLYTAYGHIVNSDIYVFANIDKANGEIPISRRINLNGSVHGLALDEGRDRLYAGLANTGLTALNEASKAGTAGSWGVLVNTPIASLAGVDSSGILAVDARNDRLYAGYHGKGYILNQASKLGESGQASALAFDAGGTTLITSFAFP